MSKTYSKTRTLVECALMIALGTVLANIKIFEMPNGGSITLLSMLPFILVSYRHGTKWGLFTGFVNSLLQMLLGFYAPPAPGLLPLVGMILLDYVLAFTLLGLAGAIAKPFKNRLVGVAVGTAAVCGIRFLCSFLSGVLIWGNLSDGLPAWTYSLTYNGSYMLPETILTTVAAVLIYKAAPQLFAAQVWKKEMLLLDDEGNELLLPKTEQIPSDFYRKGETARAVVARVDNKNNNPKIILSRTSPVFLQRLFEMEVPEINDGLITIKKIAPSPRYW